MIASTSALRKAYSSSDDDVTFTWQVLGGVRYVINKHVMLYSGVRYWDAGDVDMTIESANVSFVVEAGLRVYF